MKNAIMPTFNSTSSMHRVFGDFQPSTDIQFQDNIVGRVLLTGQGPDGLVEIKTRTWFWKPTYAPKGTVTTRFECYFNGMLVDYTRDRGLIVKTLRWLTEKGQIHKSVRALSLICLLFLGAAFASCSHQEQRGYPVVNDHQGAPWVLTGTSISETAEDLAAGQWRIDSADLKGKHTHFYYAKGDSTRHIIVYAGRVVSDKRARKLIIKHKELWNTAK